jgi:S-adenosylmethionine-diacylglycerol 3-amino-3-carboxypropyl transferase
MSPPRTDAAYFKEQLNYTLGDEDSSVELSILPEGARHVLTIAGSGGRVLPLLARAPKRLTCVDISYPQLHLTELRLTALKELEHAEFLGLLGYPPVVMAPEERERHFRRLPLSAPAREFLEGFFVAHGWAAPVYVGRFERMLRQLSQVNRLFTGKAGQGVFETRTLEEQAEYLRTRFPQTAWKAVLLLLGNSAVLNSLLYRGDFPKKNIQGSAYSIYQDVFSRLFATCLARESFFLQLVFFGELRYPEGNPIECNPDVYARAKAALGRTEIRYVRGDILETARQEGAIDFVSLSDVPSFFKGPREMGFLQELRPGLAPDARVVTRGHLRVLRPDAAGFEPVTDFHQDALNRERTQLWQVQVYRALS